MESIHHILITTIEFLQQHSTAPKNMRFRNNGERYYNLRSKVATLYLIPNHLENNIQYINHIYEKDEKRKLLIHYSEKRVETLR